MKILISAYACEPGAGSEPGTGWEWARASALDNDVWMLTRANNAAPIEAALAREPELRLTPLYIDLPPWARFWKRGQFGVHIYYLIWQILAWRAARRLNRTITFDIAHHVTFAVDWMPAGVAFAGIPTVWGPVGGASRTPWALWRYLGARGMCAEAARDVATAPLRAVFGHATARRARVVVAQNHDVAHEFSWAADIRVEPHVAITEMACTTRPPSATRSSNRNVVFVGRVLPWKGLRLALAAVATGECRDVRLEIYGDGRDRRACERLAVRLGISDRVSFLGHRSREDVLRALQHADAMVFPSMHDSAPWAVAEAVALGCPVVCLDRGGPSVLVQPGLGARVPVTSDVARDIAVALRDTRRHGGDRRWNADRLRTVTENLYSACVREPSAAGSR